MPVGLHGVFHPFKIEPHKPTDAFHRDVALAMCPSNGLHADFEGINQFISGQPRSFHRFSSQMVRTPDGVDHIDTCVGVKRTL